MFGVLCAFVFSMVRRPKNTKAGLVGPAPLFLPLGSYPGLSLPADASNKTLYITNARFSSSFWRTGMEQPDISTLPAASRAACGDTP